ncbi:glycosyltransferase family 2 protein [bacterium]|nr:glycosyltransferase family 2 protein [bacterium]
MKIVFLISVALLAYTYVGYFLVISLLGPLVRRLRRPLRVADDHRPSVTIIISLHNEEQNIGPRIDSFEALEYPADQLELLLGDDCSGDRTRAIIRERQARNPRIRLVPFDTHQGKTAVINQLVPQARGEIIGFSDANTFWEPPSLRRLTPYFADPHVGAVCGRLVLRSATGINTDDTYWRYETRIKHREQDLGVVLGAAGGIYTLRKELFRPLASHVIQIDDFIWPVRVYERGRRGVYEPAAVAHEEAAPHVEAEFRRKVRIGTGDYRALRECWRLLLPWSGWIAFCFWSHKVLRWLAPFLLVIALVSNAFLLDRSLGRILFAVQVAFYLAAAVGSLMSRQRHPVASLFRLPYYFVGGNAALLIGCWKCLTGRQQATWSQKTHRAG